LARKNYVCAPIAFGTNTDPYQPIEAQWRIMRGCIEVLAERGIPVVTIDRKLFAAPVDSVTVNNHQAAREATQHLISNIWITFTGETTADAVSYVRAWHRFRDHAKADMVLWGEYHDVWRCVDGTWRIEQRRVLEAGIEPRREGGAPNPRRAKG